MKNKSIAIIPVLSLLGAGLLMGCNQSGAKSNSPSNITRRQSLDLKVASALKFSSGVSRMRRANTPMSDEEANKVLELLPTLDILMTNGNTYSSVITEEETLINNVTYSYKETLSYTDINLQSAEETLVYNIVEKKVETEVDDDDDDEEDIDDDEDVDDDDDDDRNIRRSKDEEAEEYTKIEGYVIRGETYLPFVSMEEKFTEGNESESERTFILTLSTSSYVYIEEENESEDGEVENEFCYRLVENGITTLEYYLEIESLKDNSKSEIEYELNGVGYEIERKLNQAGNYVYEVKYQSETSEEEPVAEFEKVIDNETGLVTFVRIA